MTVIAAFLNDQCAVVGADLLLSMRRPRVMFKPPLASWVADTRIEGLTHRPLCLRQKLILLSEQICIAYSGRQDRAEFVIEQARKEHVPPSQINDFLEEHVNLYRPSEREKLSFIALAIQDDCNEDGARRISLRAINARSVDVRNGRAIAAGSGSDLFLGRFSLGKLSSFPITNPYLEDTKESYAALSSLVGFEFFHAGTLDASICGPYEIAGIIDKDGRPAVAKANGTLHLFCRIDLQQKERQLMSVDLRMFQFYWWGCLFMLISETLVGGVENTSIQLIRGLFDRDADAIEALVKNQMIYEFKPRVVKNNILLEYGAHWSINSIVDVENDITERMKVTIERGRVSVELDGRYLGERIFSMIDEGRIDVNFWRPEELDTR